MTHPQDADRPASRALLEESHARIRQDRAHHRSRLQARHRSRDRQHLAASGWNIAILDLDEASAKDAANEVAERHGVQAVGIACDVTDEASVECALAALDGSVPPVGALVNTPASPRRPLPRGHRRGMGPYLRGERPRGLNITRRVAPGMAERGFGRIVFLSSVSAERGGGVFGGVAYSAAKAAQLGFARALARELGPNGVTVNSVAPGLIDTDITGGPGGRAQIAARRRNPCRPQRQRQRRRRPDHLPLPRGVRLCHRRPTTSTAVRTSTDTGNKSSGSVTKDMLAAILLPAMH